MSKIVLYSLEASPPCRAVILTAEILGVPLKIEEVDLSKKAHLKPEFLKMNPQHTVPTLNDDGFVLTDSHAIISYLVNKYGKDDSLYPKDVQTRAIVDQFLHIDSTLLFVTVKKTFKPIVTGAVKTNCFDKEQVNDAKELYEILSNYLDGKEWLAGTKSFTLADISIVTTVLALNLIHPVQGYPKVDAWVKRCEKEMPKYEKAVVPGQKMLVERLKSYFA